MKKLKPILHSKYFYIGLLFLTIIYSIFYLCLPHFSKLNPQDNYYFGTILEMKVEGDLLTLELGGKENILGTYFFQSEEEKNNFLENYQLGDQIQLKGTFSLPKNNTVPNLFNYKEYLKRKGIYYIMQIDAIEKVEDNQNLFYQIKNSILKHIDSYQSKAYLKAFILGDTSLLSNQAVVSYQNNGISHLLAISGAQVSLFSGILLFILKKFHLNEKKSFLLTILFLSFYMFLSGSTPSISRAVVLFGLLSINKLLKWQIKTLYLFIMTFCILVLTNPYSLFEVGFQYSFMISFYLILMQKKLKNTQSYAKGLLQISMISFLVSFPISIYYFYQINLFSIGLNLIFVPLVSFIVFPLSLLTFLLPFLDSVFFWITQLMEELSIFFSNSIVWNTIWKKPNIGWIILYYGCLTLWLCYRKKIGFLGIGILLCYQYFYLSLFPQNFFLMIDVGQGDSLLIYSHNQTMLIDTGGKISYSKEPWQERQTKSLSDTTLLPLLKSLGIRKLDYLVLSHGDYDHMGESINLVNHFKVETVILNHDSLNPLEQELVEVLDKKRIPYYKNVKELILNNNKLSFLNHKLYDNENDNSNVIYFEFNGIKMLLTGDAGIEVEEDIIKKYHLNNIDILKVGHHGSKTSTSNKLIDEIHPKYSIISVGKNNRYHHPNKEVLDILKNSIIYRTDIDGSIMLKIKNNQLEIETCTP